MMNEMKIKKFVRVIKHLDFLTGEHLLIAIFKIEGSEEYYYTCIAISMFLRKFLIPKRPCHIKRLAKLIVLEHPEYVYKHEIGAELRRHTIINKLYDRWMRKKIA